MAATDTRPLARRLAVPSHLREGGLPALLAAFVISQIGESMALVGMPWFVLETTGNVARMSLVVAVGGVSSAVFGLLGGPVVDRIGLQRAAIVSYLIGGLAIGAVPLLHWTGHLHFGVLLALSAGAGAFDAPATAAVSGMLGGLAGAAGRSLESANSMFQGAGQLVFLVGPALAGVLASGYGAGLLLAIDAAGCSVAAAVVALGVRIRPARRSSSGTGPSRSSGYLVRLREGFAMLRTDPVLRFLVVFTTAVGALDLAVVSVVMVAYSHQVLGNATGFGAMVTAYSLGVLAGALLYGTAGARWRRRPVFLAGYGVAGLLFVVLLAEPGTAGVLVAVTLVGLVSAPTETIGTAVTQERVPMQVYGRVVGVRSTVSAVCAPVAVAGTGSLFAAGGLTATLVTVAAVYLVALFAGLRSRALHHIESPARHSVMTSHICHDTLHSGIGPRRHTRRRAHARRRKQETMRHQIAYPPPRQAAQSGPPRHREPV